MRLPIATNWIPPVASPLWWRKSFGVLHLSLRCQYYQYWPTCQVMMNPWCIYKLYGICIQNTTILIFMGLYTNKKNTCPFPTSKNNRQYNCVSLVFIHRPISARQGKATLFMSHFSYERQTQSASQKHRHTIKHNNKIR